MLCLSYTDQGCSDQMLTWGQKMLTIWSSLSYHVQNGIFSFPSYDITLTLPKCWTSFRICTFLSFSHAVCFISGKGSHAIICQEQIYPMEYPKISLLQTKKLAHSIAAQWIKIKCGKVNYFAFASTMNKNTQKKGFFETTIHYYFSQLCKQ